MNSEKIWNSKDENLIEFYAEVFDALNKNFDQMKLFLAFGENS
jgi:hypothetical protein